ncbi:site-specific DNA-methyltransferase [Candidatus Dependentiae bacterium]|nr:site-specific DNA-methyltransferase [Candidatus Dependentiae bacterium]
MDKLKMQTPDLTDKNIEQIAKIFPNVITETRDENGTVKKAVDFDLLKQVLSKELVEDDNERYRLDWPGKKASLLKANTPITKTLRPCREESVNFDTTENLYIEGDNFEVLKILQESYLGKVKMIYIDPPYNTGNDFIYKDNFKMSKEKYELELGVESEDGEKLFRNTDSNGRFHSDWLSMMYERLVVARDLLKDDGVIFISIDDSEQENLKKICDEIYGENNFVNTISVNMKNVAGASGGGEDKRLKKNIEYVLIYLKNISSFSSFVNVFEYFPISTLIEQYKEDEKSWKYTSVLIEEGNKRFIGSTIDGDGNDINIYLRENYSIKSVGQIVKENGITESEVYTKYASKIFQTAMPQSSIRPRVMEKVKELGVKGDLFSIEYKPKSGRNKSNLYEQFYKGNKFRLFAWLKDVTEEINGVLYKKEMQGTYWDFVGDTKNLTKEGNIPYPNGKKPVNLVKRLLTMQEEKDMIVLDFFSGSSTTAHAVIQLNAEDGGNRKFIMVQLQENIKSDTNENIDFVEYLNKEKILPIVTEVGKERIRRAGKKIIEELKAINPSLKLGEEPVDASKLDIGFRVYKVDDTNMKDVFYHPSELNQKQLSFLESNIKDDRTPEDLLTQVILDLGLELSLPIETKMILGNTVFIVQTNALVACFDNDIDFKIVDAISDLKPLKVVFKDASFKDDKDRINVEERFKRLSPETKVTVI